MFGKQLLSFCAGIVSFGLLTNYINIYYLHNCGHKFQHTPDLAFEVSLFGLAVITVTSAIMFSVAWLAVRLFGPLQYRNWLLVPFGYACIFQLGYFVIILYKPNSFAVNWGYFLTVPLMISLLLALKARKHSSKPNIVNPLKGDSIT